MYCTRCKYTSFDALKDCPNCGFDWDEDRKFFNVSWLEQNETVWLSSGGQSGGAGMNREQEPLSSDAGFMQDMDLDESGLFSEEPLAEAGQSDEEELFVTDEDEPEPVEAEAFSSLSEQEPESGIDLFEDEETIEVETSTADADSFSIPELDAMFGTEEENEALLQDDIFEEVPEAGDEYDALSKELELDDVEELDQPAKPAPDRKTKQSAAEVDADNLLDGIELDLEDEE